jgi:hypothetical protein
MHRCGSGFLLILAIILVISMAGCLGKSSGNTGNGGVSTVTLNPSASASLDVGGTMVFSATGKNAGGGTVLGVNIQYVVGVPAGVTTPAALSVASNGNTCAGTWNTTVSICSPGTPGLATVNAVINGVYSPTTIVYVHQHIDSIQISQLNPQGPPQYDCFSQGQAWGYQANAYSSNVDITNTVGPMFWYSSNPTVVTVTPVVSGTSPNQIQNQVQVTAKIPGITELNASVGGAISDAYPYTTCLIAAVYLQIGGQGQAGNSITVDNGSTIPITAIAVDTLHAKNGSPPLTNPPLTWSTTNPEVAAFTTTTNSTGTNSASARNNLGGATLFASCTPPSCNIGLPGITPSGVTVPSLPIYASDCLPTSVPLCKLPDGTKGWSTISVDVTSTSKTPTYTAYSATTECQNQPGCTSVLFSVTPGLTPIGSNIYSLPRTPNSLMFNHLSAARLYIGSDQGLMYLTIGSSNTSPILVSTATVPCDVSLCGKVLTISNDGKFVVVSDNTESVSTPPQPNQVYIYNGVTAGAAPVTLIFDNAAFPGEYATAAAFSPDELKLFITTNMGNLYVYSTVDALTWVSIASPGAPPATDVEPSVDGSFVYVAGAPGTTSISGYANCDTPTTSVLSGVTTAAAPLNLYPLPTLELDPLGNWTEVVAALAPPNIDTFGVNVTQSPLPDGQFVCIPPTVALDTTVPKTSVNLGQGNFTPVYSRLAGDGTEIIVVARKLPAVLLFNISSGTTTSVPLVGNTDPLSASASVDGSQVYIAACDQYASDGKTCTAGSVHIVNTISGGDLQQVPYVNINDNNNPNMCNSQGAGAPLCLPNLIAIRPQ